MDFRNLKKAPCELELDFLYILSRRGIFLAAFKHFSCTFNSVPMFDPECIPLFRTKLETKSQS